MTGNSGYSVAPTKEGDSQPLWNRLAKLAYFLACLGPLALPVRVGTYSQQNPHAPPDVRWQVLWWVLCLASPVAVVLGTITLFQIQRSAISRKGRTHSIAGIVVGLLASLVLFQGTQSLDEMWWQSFPRHISCKSNVKQLSLATLMYVQDYDERFPLPASWNEGIVPYIRNADVFRCPDESVQSVSSYAFNRSLQNVKANGMHLAGQTVMIFDSIPGRNRAGRTELLPDPPRHNGGHTIGFVDGHVEVIAEANLAALIWKPNSR